MPRFKMILRTEMYEHCYVEADNLTSALKLYESEHFNEDNEWKTESFGTSELYAIDEMGEDGNAIATHDVEVYCDNCRAGNHGACEDLPDNDSCQCEHDFD